MSFCISGLTVTGVGSRRATQTHAREEAPDVRPPVWTAYRSRLGPRGIPEIENWRLETGLPIGLQETHLGQSPISASVKAREMRGL